MNAAEPVRPCTAAAPTDHAQESYFHRGRQLGAFGLCHLRAEQVVSPLRSASHSPSVQWESMNYGPAPPHTHTQGPRGKSSEWMTVEASCRLRRAERGQAR